MERPLGLARGIIIGSILAGPVWALVAIGRYSAAGLYIVLLVAGWIILDNWLADELELDVWRAAELELDEFDRKTLRIELQGPLEVDGDNYTRRTDETP